MSSPTRRPSPRPRPEPATATATATGQPAQSEPAPGETGGRKRGRTRRIAAATRSATTTSVADSKRIWRTSRDERRAARRTEPLFDASSWLGAIIVMGLFAAAVWVVQIVNAQQHYTLNRFGLVPRDTHGLWGILLTPFLHATYGDMASDTLPILLIGWVVLLAGVRIWTAVTVVVVLVGGALTWLIGSGGHAVILGSSGLVFGWLGYLVARAVFSRKIKWILAAAMVLLVFGTLLGQLVPVAHSHESWQLHLASFVAGVGIGALLHPRRARRRAGARSQPSAAS